MLLAEILKEFDETCITEDYSGSDGFLKVNAPVEFVRVLLTKAYHTGYDHGYTDSEKGEPNWNEID